MSSLRKPAVSQSLASLLTRSIHRLTRPQPASAVVPVAGAMVHAACDARPSSRRATLAGAAVLIGALALSFAIPAQADTKKVRYEEVVRSVLYMPMYVAMTKGYFKEEGLDVSLKTSQGTDKGMAALLAGSADIVLIGPEASVYVANSESPVKTRVFAGLTATDGFLLLAREPADSFDWSMLKGKRVMSFRPGSNPDVFLMTAMEKHGLDPAKDVRMVSNIGPAARAGAWMAGQADYGIFLEPEASNLERDGHGKVVASIGEEVGQVDFTSFTATEKFLADNPDVAQKWVNAIYRAQQEIQNAPAADLATHMQPFFPGLSHAELVGAVERYRPFRLWKENPVVEEAAMNQLQDMLIKMGLQKDSERVAYANLVETRFAKEAMK